MTLHASYIQIHDAWDNQESQSDIYHMILKWIGTYRPEAACPGTAPYVKHFIDDAMADVSTNDIVEDFIYGENYKPLRDIMDAYGEATKLLQDYVDGCGTKEYPSDWKHLCMSLTTLANGPDSPFRRDAYEGLHWMNMIVFNRLCETCNDNKAFEWMKAFAKAWVTGETLPKFSEIGCTCLNP
jgi:hypothetical protein